MTDIYKTVAALVEQLKDHQKDIKAIYNKFVVSQSIDSTYKDRLNHLKQKIQDQETALEAELNATTLTVSAAQDLKEDLSTRISKITSLLDQTPTQSLQQLKWLTDSYNTDMGSLQTALAKVQGSIAQIHTLAAQIKQKIDKMHATHLVKTVNQTGQLSKMLLMLSTFYKNLSAVEVSLASVLHTIVTTAHKYTQQFHTNITALETTLTNLTNHLRALVLDNSDIDLYIAKFKQLRSNLQETVQSKTALSSQLASVSVQYNKYSEQYATLQDTIQDKQSTITNYNKQKTTLLASVSEKTNTVNTLTEAYNKLTQKYNSAKKQVVVLAFNLQDYQRRLSQELRAQAEARRATTVTTPAKTLSVDSFSRFTK